MELKPCPFCGGPGQIDPALDQDGVAHWYYAICPACGLENKGAATAELAAAWWNKRDTLMLREALKYIVMGSIELDSCWNELQDQKIRVGEAYIRLHDCEKSLRELIQRNPDEGDGWGTASFVTHWMPLPEPPEVGND